MVFPSGSSISIVGSADEKSGEFIPLPGIYEAAVACLAAPYLLNRINRIIRFRHNMHLLYDAHVCALSTSLSYRKSQFIARSSRTAWNYGPSDRNSRRDAKSAARPSRDWKPPPHGPGHHRATERSSSFSSCAARVSSLRSIIRSRSTFVAAMSSSCSMTSRIGCTIMKPHCRYRASM